MTSFHDNSSIFRGNLHHKYQIMSLLTSALVFYRLKILYSLWEPKEVGTHQCLHRIPARLPPSNSYLRMQHLFRINTGLTKYVINMQGISDSIYLWKSSQI